MLRINSLPGSHRNSLNRSSQFGSNSRRNSINAATTRLKSGVNNIRPLQSSLEGPLSKTSGFSSRNTLRNPNVWISKSTSARRMEEKQLSKLSEIDAACRERKRLREIRCKDKSKCLIPKLLQEFQKKKLNLLAGNRRKYRPKDKRKIKTKKCCCFLNEKCAKRYCCCKMKTVNDKCQKQQYKCKLEKLEDKCKKKKFCCCCCSKVVKKKNECVKRRRFKCGEEELREKKYCCPVKEKKHKKGCPEVKKKKPNCKAAIIKPLCDDGCRPKGAKYYCPELEAYYCAGCGPRKLPKYMYIVKRALLSKANGSSEKEIIKYVRKRYSHKICSKSWERDISIAINKMSLLRYIKKKPNDPMRWILTMEGSAFKLRDPPKSGYITQRMKRKMKKYRKTSKIAKV